MCKPVNENKNEQKIIYINIETSANTHRQCFTVWTEINCMGH